MTAAAAPATGHAISSVNRRGGQPWSRVVFSRQGRFFITAVHAQCPGVEAHCTSSSTAYPKTYRVGRFIVREELLAFQDQCRPQHQAAGAAETGTAAQQQAAPSLACAPSLSEAHHKQEKDKREEQQQSAQQKLQPEQQQQGLYAGAPQLQCPKQQCQGACGCCQGEPRQLLVSSGHARGAWWRRWRLLTRPSPTPHGTVAGTSTTTASESAAGVGCLHLGRSWGTSLHKTLARLARRITPRSLRRPAPEHQHAATQEPGAAAAAGRPQAAAADDAAAGQKQAGVWGKQALVQVDVVGYTWGFDVLLLQVSA